MNGPIAQLVALTCHGNAYLEGRDIPAFFPENSTCQFCDYIHFLEFRKPLFRKVKEVIVAENPNFWMEYLKQRGASGIRLFRKPKNDPNISDRMSAGFIGGGGEWSMIVSIKTGDDDLWMARWDVWSQNAPENRIWRVDYGLVNRVSCEDLQHRSLEQIWKEFKKSLVDIHDFSISYTQDGFTDCFSKALIAIDDPEADIGYHKDLFLDGQLTPQATSMLKAAMSSWVYGGMGSWNDMGFDGNAQKEYDRVSEQHFRLLNEVIEAVASSTHPEKKGGFPTSASTEQF